MKTNRLTFRVAIISLYFFLSLIMIGIATVSIIYFDNLLVRMNITKEFSYIEANATNAITKIDRIKIGLLKLVSNFEQVKKDFDSADTNKFLKVFSTLMTHNTDLSAVYIAYVSGDFYEVINLDINDKLHTLFGAEPNDRWLEVSIKYEDGKHLQQYTLYDKNLNLTSISSQIPDYDPTERYWFKSAINSETVIKTSPYLFAGLNCMGVTYALKVTDTTVLSLDMLTEDIGTALNSFKLTNSTVIYLLNNKKDIYATTGDSDNEMAFNEQLVDEVKKSTLSVEERKPQHYTTTIDGHKYILHTSKFRTPMGDETYLSMATPFKDAIAKYKERGIKVLFACIGALVMMIPLILYLVSRVIHPISLLKIESDKVSKRQFSNIRKVKTKLLEIDELSDSICIMSKSIYDYQHNLEQKIEERTKELEEKNILLEKLAVTDALTNVSNRMKVDQVLESEISRIERYGGSLSIILLDIDHFKKVNDTYGHQTGDSVLIEFAEILQNAVRRTDTVGRWGGEEFIIVCPETDMDEIKILAESVRKKIQAFNFKEVGNITASLGTATYIAGMHENELIAKADAGLYEAKDTGRNKVVQG
jgi:two-component system cell cycle response regulator